MRTRSLVILTLTLGSLIGVTDASAGGCRRMTDPAGDAEVVHDPLIDVPLTTPQNPDTALDLLRADVDDDGRRLRVTVTHGGFTTTAPTGHQYSVSLKRGASNETGDIWLVTTIFRTREGDLWAHAQPHTITGQDNSRRKTLPVKEAGSTLTVDIPYAPFGLMKNERLQELSLSTATAYGEADDPFGSGQPVPVYTGFNADLARADGFVLGAGCRRSS